MKRLSVVLLCAAVFGTTLFTYTAVSAATPEETIVARRANQKRVAELVKSVDTGLKANAPAASMVEALTEIDQRTHLIKGYFPDGTQTGDTKALPTIWSNRAGFDAVADQYIADFGNLLKLAKAGDAAAMPAALQKATGNCGACHRDFRAR